MLSSSGLSIGVVIPAFNPCHRLGDVLTGLPPFVSCVVVVDDGSNPPISTDRLVSPRPVVVVRHEWNRGVGAAIVTGYRRCIEMGIDVAVVMGADDQMDPADMERLVAPILAGRVAYAKGDRLSHPACRAVMPLPRLLGNSCLTFLTRLVTGLPVMDSQCGYTAFRLDASGRLPLSHIYPRYGFPNDMLAALSGAGLPVCDVVVRPVYPGGRSGIVAPVAAIVYPFVLARSILTRCLAAMSRGHRAFTLDSGSEAGKCAF
ncbi:MAG TPA: glycosyltransferase family 2 protein [Myxococcota bacterium]|nr:glycosyltransferase family 2 protein [Myxococcota bacterium]HNZ03153.1 glycosyltransferase family 2 protein [Myxococcota bacterium]HOH77123.1 glycosyltransferase family 2 protein [Myxococcota bacterium]